MEKVGWGRREGVEEGWRKGGKREEGRVPEEVEGRLNRLVGGRIGKSKAPRK